MNERSKYSLNGLYKCENFAQHVEQNNFPRVPIGSAGGIDEWFITFLTKNDENNMPIVYPRIFADKKPTLRLRRFFKVIKKDGPSCFKTRGYRTTHSGNGPKGKHINIAELLNNGYLDDDGALTVEYGIHVEGILENDGIWKFNFHDKFFKSENAFEIECGDSENEPAEVFYGHRQLLRFHSPFYEKGIADSVAKTMEEFRIEECLQMSHGVRIQIDSISNYWLILWIAHNNKLRNVIQYVDQQLVNKYSSPEDGSFDVLMFVNCIEVEMRHLLAHLVNQFKDLGDLKSIIQQLDIQKMSGEAMKMFAAKIFKHKT